MCVAGPLCRQLSAKGYSLPYHCFPSYYQIVKDCGSSTHLYSQIGKLLQLQVYNLLRDWKIPFLCECIYGLSLPVLTHCRLLWLPQALQLIATDYWYSLYGI